MTPELTWWGGRGAVIHWLLQFLLERHGKDGQEGAVTSLFIGAMLQHFLGAAGSGHWLILAVLVSVFGPLGDLLESLLKREGRNQGFRPDFARTRWVYLTDLILTPLQLLLPCCTSFLPEPD